ncbi:MAG: hypothetical protein J6S57_00025 [Alphaproteobacteria bacterium]|nr:hypothetical protein [Alphaproteobacteria bacterium]
MKKNIFIFLLSGLMAWLPCGFVYADGDEYEGELGTSYSVDPGKGGKIVGLCAENGLSKGADCKHLVSKKGALKAQCIFTDRAETQLSCTTLLCDYSKGWVRYKGKGFCVKEDALKKDCEAQKSRDCSPGQESKPKLKNESDGKNKYFEYKDGCFCADRDTIIYDCGMGDGEPPHDSNTYTNLQPRTLLYPDNCKMTNGRFVSWKCDNSGDYNPNESFRAAGVVRCTAQWECEKCEPGGGCDCVSEMKQGGCMYNTAPKSGYKIVNGNGTSTPQCELNTDCLYGEYYDFDTKQCLPKCNTKIAYWDGEKCICTQMDKKYIENVEDISKSVCKCPNGQYDIGGECVTLGKCEELKQNKASEDRLACCVLEESGITIWKGDNKSGECKCLDPNKIFIDGECRCDSGRGFIDDGNGGCTEREEPVPEKTVKCPDDAKGTTPPNCVCNDDTKRYDANKNECIKDLKKIYDDAKAREQSLANRTLTAATTAATGLGMMEAFRGHAEQEADAAADADMTAYLETFRCTYGNGKTEKGGFDLIELPGGNDDNMMQLRTEYFDLAQSLKERKESLGMKPGIESEVVLDKAQMGLYNNENVGITGGAYSSLYRAKALNSEEDKTKIESDKEKSEKRFKYGATAAAVGVAGGIIGNSLINGKLGEGIDKLGEKIKERKKDKELQKKLNVLEESTKNINIEAGENFDAALNQVIQGFLNKK